jgi:DNA (cytosine-5)-methyltransferase 1
MIYNPYEMKEVVKAESQNKFTVISTFAGGGGSSTGYRLAGGNILCVNEFVEEAQKTYAANYPDTPILTADIKTLTAKDFLDAANIKKGELDILDGSPPCSAFSVSGSVANKSGGKVSDGWAKSGKNYSDGKKVDNIEDLFFEYLRIAEGIQPKVIIAENVAGLTIGEAKQYYNAITNTFDQIGYDVSSQVLDSKYYGVPQTRKRVFFIGVRKDITEKVGLTFMNIHGLFPEPNREVTCLGPALEGIVNDPENVKWLIEKWTNTAHWKDTGVNMPTDPLKRLNDYEYHPKAWHFNVKRSSRFDASPTITATGATSTGAGAFHWSEPRKFTIPELKRIMSIPDDYILTGAHDKQAERLGRMVTPFIMKAIASSIYDNVLGEL